MVKATRHRRLRKASFALLCTALVALPVGAQDGFGTGEGVRDDDPALRDAERMPLAVRSLLLDVASGGEGLVAVGERGHVLLSADGAQWTQARHVPTRSTLTAVAAFGDALWAVGHDGVVIHSTDGGNAWTRQRAAPWVDGALDEEAGVPLLDVLFLDDQHGIAIGAFSLLLETRDGGESWEAAFLSELAVSHETHVDGEDAGDAFEASSPESDDDLLAEEDDVDDWGFSADDLMLDEEDDPHLNAITRGADGGLMIAAERGTVFRSTDDGGTWERLRLPYEGSMFGVLSWEAGHVMVFGLRGNVFESHDFGDSWTRLESGTEASLMGGLALPGGGAVLVGNEGRVLHRATAGAPFRTLTHTNEDGETPVLSSVVALDGAGYILLGERGVDRAAGLD